MDVAVFTLALACWLVLAWLVVVACTQMARALGQPSWVGQVAVDLVFAAASALMAVLCLRAGFTGGYWVQAAVAGAFLLLAYDRWRRNRRGRKARRWPGKVVRERGRRLIVQDR